MPAMAPIPNGLEEDGASVVVVVVVGSLVGVVVGSMVGVIVGCTTATLLVVVVLTLSLLETGPILLLLGAILLDNTVLVIVDMTCTETDNDEVIG